MKRNSVKIFWAAIPVLFGLGLGAPTLGLLPVDGSLLGGGASHASAKVLSSVAVGPTTRPASQPAGSGFSYQGKLLVSGQPASGQYDLQFSLYDALTGGNLVGGPITLTNQTVTGGLFTVSLDFGAGAFQGDARWLETAVRQAGGGNYTRLSPRQPLSATPYAQSLVPGATINNAVDYGNMLSLVNSGTYGRGLMAVANDTAVYGSSSGTGGKGSMERAQVRPVGVATSPATA